MGISHCAGGRGFLMGTTRGNQVGERASSTQSCRLLPAMRDPRGTMGMRHQEVGW